MFTACPSPPRRRHDSGSVRAELVAGVERALSGPDCDMSVQPSDNALVGPIRLGAGFGLRTRTRKALP